MKKIFTLIDAALMAVNVSAANKVLKITGTADKAVSYTHLEQTYTDGPFPFYAMGCEPPVVNGAIHFVPTGDWSQFFVMPSSNTVSYTHLLRSWYR